MVKRQINQPSRSLDLLMLGDLLRLGVGIERVLEAVCHNNVCARSFISRVVAGRATPGERKRISALLLKSV
jgi:predicted amidohydrolase